MHFCRIFLLCSSLATYRVHATTGRARLWHTALPYNAAFLKGLLVCAILAEHLAAASTQLSAWKSLPAFALGFVASTSVGPVQSDLLSLRGELAHPLDATSHRETILIFRRSRGG
jgi:hypothetical protein